MTPAQTQEAQTVLADVQIGLAALAPFATLAGPEQPGVQLTIGIIGAGVTALQNAMANGTDITDAQLAAIKAGEQASIDDDKQAQIDAWNAGDHSGVDPTAASGTATAQGLRPATGKPTDGNYTSDPGYADGQAPQAPGPAAGSPST